MTASTEQGAKMATIICSYKGRCELGPWSGQEIHAERSIVTHDSLDGAYRWRGGAWRWRPAANRDARMTAQD